ncbi:MAG: sugar phosphate isomerase/epimerase family protein [Planctomycetota bacterium]
MGSARPYRLGYNTNGFAFHRLEDAAEIMHELGYKAIALTLDVHHLNPFTATEAELCDWRQRFLELDLEVVIETVARFLLDPHRKHRPTLVSPTPAERARRAQFLRTAVECAARLGARVVSTWSGALDDDPGRDPAWGRLAGTLVPILDAARACGVMLAIEPEPAMVIETLQEFESFKDFLGRDDLWLTVDAGHLQVTESPPFEPLLRRAARHLVNVHLDDAHTGVHEHLFFFGDGELPVGDVCGCWTSCRSAGSPRWSCPATRTTPSSRRGGR